MNKIIVSIVITLVLPKLVKVLAKATLAGFVLQTTLTTALSKLWINCEPDETKIAHAA